MAARSPSKLQNFIFLLFLTLVHLQDIEDTEAITEQENVEETGNLDEELYDYVAILEAPESVIPNFYVDIVYRCKEQRVVSLEIYSKGVLEVEKEELKYSFVVESATREIQRRKIRVTFRDSLIFRDNIALNITSDLHTRHIIISVSLMDVLPSTMASELATVFTSDSLDVTVVTPWQRPHKPGYCFPMFVEYKQNAVDKRIPLCGLLNDVKKLIDFPVAVTGKEEGFKKFLPHLYWPDMEAVEAHHNSKPRFTISTFIYILDLCPNTLCGILHHRSTKDFLTPVISLVQSSQLHIQVSYEDGTPFALLINAPIPWNTWVHLIISVDDTLLKVYTRYGEGFLTGTNTVQTSFPMGSFHFLDTDGYWAIGGNYGFSSFKGFVGQTTIYRTKALSVPEITLPPTDHPMFAIGLDDHFKRCFLVKEVVTTKMEQFRKERVANASTNGSCPSRQQSVIRNALRGHVTHARQCDVTLSGETPEIEALVFNLLRNASMNLESVSEYLHQAAVKAMSENIKLIPWALGLLRVSGCLGNGKASYASAVVHMTGLGSPQDKSKGWLHLLLGATSGHTLSQMSMGFRHFLGADGVTKDCEASAGYYSMAAMRTDKVLQEHHAVHTHSEAVRLDDYDELANHRGTKSDLFQWLSHQAMQGLSDAQSLMGEMHYYGKRGFQRDLREAAKFYQMSAEKGNAEGLFNLGISKLKGHGTEKNETEAIELIRKAADTGMGAAFNALGFYEVNLRKNVSGGVIYFMRAAKTGDRDGLFNLGVAYDNGWVEGSVPDKFAAFKYFELAANKGHPGACIQVGEDLRVGQYLRRDCTNAVVYLRFLAEQNPEMGWLLRRALNAYYATDWYKSMVFFLLAAEAGMEVPQYNIALLCEENWEELINKTAVDCIWRYYNTSAELGWVHSMMKMGDNHWYGKTLPRDTSAAALMYTKAVEKNGHAHALYNLGYMVEYNYSLPGMRWGGTDGSLVKTGNLSDAAVIYRKCRDTTANGNESYLPCAIAVVKVTLKEYYHDHPLKVQILMSAAIALVVAVTLCLALVDDRLY